MRDNDVVIAVDDIDTKWKDHNFIADKILQCKDKNMRLTIVSVMGLYASTAQQVIYPVVS